MEARKQGFLVTPPLCCHCWRSVAIPLAFLGLRGLAFLGVSACVRCVAPSHPAVAPCFALNPAFPHPSPLPEGEGTVPPRKRRVFALSGGSTNARGAWACMAWGSNHCCPCRSNGVATPWVLGLLWFA